MRLFLPSIVVETEQMKDGQPVRVTLIGKIEGVKTEPQLKVEVWALQKSGG